MHKASSQSLKSRNGVAGQSGKTGRGTGLLAKGLAYREKIDWLVSMDGP